MYFTVVKQTYIQVMTCSSIASSETFMMINHYGTVHCFHTPDYNLLNSLVL